VVGAHEEHAIALSSATGGKFQVESCHRPDLLSANLIQFLYNDSSGLENEITEVGIRRADHATPLYPQKLALISSTRCGRSVGIVRSRTKATELRKQ
jgi:hypothetical protein